MEHIVTQESLNRKDQIFEMLKQKGKVPLRSLPLLCMFRK